MKALMIGKATCVFSVALACVIGLAACNDIDSSSSKTKVEGLTGGVAATVNGSEIKEDTITTDIELYRSSAGLTDQETWGQWLADYGYTPQSVREEMIESYINQELIKQAAEEKGIEVPSSEIDEYVNKTKSYYDTTTAWEEALETAGITEDEYRDSIKQALLEQKVQAAVSQAEKPTEEEILEGAQTYASYYSGAKRSSHILFEASNEATAKEVLNKLNDGELDFAEAAKEYSKDTASAEKGGDVGWDKMGSFVTEYTNALTTLEKGQISSLVTSEYGIHIIKCTDVFIAPEEVTNLDQIPDEFVDAIKSNLEKSKKSEAFNAWLEEYRKSADIVINEIPENVPYNVDMSQFTATNSSYNDSTVIDSSTPTGTDDIPADSNESDTTGENESNTSDSERNLEEQPAEAA